MIRGSIFHPSGHASLTAVREFMQLLPCAAAVADADTNEILSLSPPAQALTGALPDRWHTTSEFKRDQEAHAKRLRQLEQQPSVPMRFTFEGHDIDGNPFTAASSMVLTEMVGRRVVLITCEPIGGIT